MSDDDAEEAHHRVMGKIAQVIETLTAEDAQSFLALVHNGIEELLAEHEEEHPDLYT